MKAARNEMNGSTAIPPVADNLVVRRAQAARDISQEAEALRSGAMSAVILTTINKHGLLRTATHVEGDEGTLYTLIASLEETKLQVLQHLQMVKTQRQRAQ